MARRSSLGVLKLSAVLGVFGAFWVFLASQGRVGSRGIASAALAGPIGAQLERHFGVQNAMIQQLRPFEVRSLGFSGPKSLVNWMAFRFSAPLLLRFSASQAAINRRQRSESK